MNPISNIWVRANVCLLFVYMLTRDFVVDDAAYCVEVNAEVFVRLYRRQCVNCVSTQIKDKEVSLAELLDLIEEDTAVSDSEPVRTS